MFCLFCKKNKKNNAFTNGTSNFQKSTLREHIQIDDHKTSIKQNNIENE